MFQNSLTPLVPFYLHIQNRYRTTKNRHYFLMCIHSIRESLSSQRRDGKSESFVTRTDCST